MGTLNKRLREEAAIRINTTIYGEPAKMLLELKRKNIFTSNTDAVIQSIRVFYNKVVEEELKRAQLRTLETTEET